MDAKDLVLNIAVNMGRLAKWAVEGKYARIKQFISDTDIYVEQLDRAQQSERFKPTYLAFRKKFEELKKNKPNEIWAEDALTWANILTHRAKLA